METDSSARRAQPVDELLNTFDISRTFTGHSNVHSTDETDEKEDTMDNDPKVDLFLPTPSMQGRTTCPPTPRKRPLKNISGTTTPQTNPMRSKTNTLMKIMNTPR